MRYLPDNTDPTVARRRWVLAQVLPPRLGASDWDLSVRVLQSLHVHGNSAHDYQARLVSSGTCYTLIREMYSFFVTTFRWNHSLRNWRVDEYGGRRGSPWSSAISDGSGATILLK